MSHVVFIGSDEREVRRRSVWLELPRRVVASFQPPIGPSKVYVDWVGPSLALILLAFLLHFGHYNKLPSASISAPPFVSLFIYAVMVPAVCYFFAKIGRSDLSLDQIWSLFGYGLFSHVVTLTICLTVDHESSNTLFFLCLIVFGGLSSLRVAVILLLTIPKPAARLLVCSAAALVQLLFLVFIHFAYMHRTFTYGHHRLTPVY